MTRYSSFSPPLPVPIIQGKVDPNNDDELSGSKTEVEKDPRVVITITHTWRFAR